jgi:hypothetical protein
VENTTAGMPPPIQYLAGMAGNAQPSTTAAMGDKQRRDPPGFDEFKTDPEFCLIILRAVDKWKNENRSLVIGQSAVSLFVHGLLNSESFSLVINSMRVPNSANGALTLPHLSAQYTCNH